MARPGPSKKPTALKLVEGTYRKDREPETPVQTSAMKPKPAPYLTARGKQIFKTMLGRLEEIGLATESHSEALNILSLKLSDVERLTKYLNRRGVGYTYETKSTHGNLMIKPRPEVAMVRDATRDATRLLIEFGLTPSSCGGIDLGVIPGAAGGRAEPTRKPKPTGTDPWDGI